MFVDSSTGGLVCRGILSTLSEHNVNSFISLSSPQAGQYGGQSMSFLLQNEFVLSFDRLLVYTHTADSC